MKQRSSHALRLLRPHPLCPKPNQLIPGSQRRGPTLLLKGLGAVGATLLPTGALLVTKAKQPPTKR